MIQYNTIQDGVLYYCIIIPAPVPGLAGAVRNLVAVQVRQPGLGRRLGAVLCCLQSHGSSCGHCASGGHWHVFRLDRLQIDNLQYEIANQC